MNTRLTTPEAVRQTLDLVYAHEDDAPDFAARFVEAGQEVTGALLAMFTYLSKVVADMDETGELSPGVVRGQLANLLIEALAELEKREAAHGGT